MYKVYLLDDTPYMIERLKYIINWESFGFEIAGFASDGEEGLKEILSKEIDLVITNITLPKLTGFEIIESLREKNYKSKFIVFSSSQEFEYVKKAINIGVDNYIKKPIDKEELIESIKHINKKIKLKEIDDKAINNNLMLSILKHNNLENIDMFLKNFDIKKEFKYRVGIIELKDKSENKNKILEKIMNDKHIIHCVDNINTVIFLIDTDEIDYVDNITDLKNEISYLTKDNVYISIGKEVLNYNELYSSYETAMNLSEYKLIYPNTSWIRQYKKIAEEYEDFDINFNFIKEMLKNKKFEELYLEIKYIFKNLRENNNLTPKQIKYKSLEIFINIYNCINEFKLIKNLDDCLNNGLQKENIDDIEFEILNMIKLIENKLGNTQESISPIILKLLRNIEKNYDKDLNLKEISYELKVNSIYLGQLFQKETGSLFSDYINNYRINKAKELLMDTRLKAKEIGALVGYSNKNYFYRKFKSIVGATPSEWRKLNF